MNKHNMIGAMQETLNIACARRGITQFGLKREVRIPHLISMLERVSLDFSEAKLGRWLGYMQGVLVCHYGATLDEVKALNMRHTDESPGLRRSQIR